MVTRRLWLVITVYLKFRLAPQFKIPRDAYATYAILSIIL